MQMRLNPKHVSRDSIWGGRRRVPVGQRLVRSRAT